MNLSELEALAKAAAVIDHNEKPEWYSEEELHRFFHYPKNYRFIAAANPARILQMIALIRQLGDALEVASDLTMPYDDCECPICKAVDAWKEFKHGAKVL